MIRYFSLLAALGVALVASGPASAQEKSELFVVAKKTPLLSYAKEPPEEVASLQPGDLLLQKATRGTAASKMRHVVLLDSRKEPLVGWVDSRQFYSFRGGESPLPPALDEGDLKDYPPSLPALIRRAPERVQQAYRDVEATIAANKRLKKELPEPYFLRAKLWTLVGNYDAALRDYVAASALVKDQKLDPARYATYFDGMTKLLDGLERVPRAPDAGNAAYHYNQGRSAFWAGQYNRALRYFDDAIALDPGEPLYWYYRGLSFYKQGNDRRAEHDIRLGAHLERLNRREGKNSGYLLTALERLQGPPRQWMNKIRNSDHAAR